MSAEDDASLDLPSFSASLSSWEDSIPASDIPLLSEFAIMESINFAAGLLVHLDEGVWRAVCILLLLSS